MTHLPELEPDPEFARQLEWQLRTALRREGRFSRPVGLPGLRLLRSAALVLVSVALGAGGVVAADRLQDLREREILIARAELMADVQRARLERADLEAERMRALFEAGAVPSREVDATRTAREHLHHDLRRLQLDLDEIRASGREPDDELDAAVVSGRDFVLERLGLELERLRVARDASERETARQRAHVEAGRASPEGLRRAERELGRVDLELAGLQRRIDLRRSWLAGGVPRAEVRLLAMRAAAETAREVASAALAALVPELERFEALVAAGVVSSAERGPVEERAALEAELALAELELELVDARLGR